LSADKQERKGSQEGKGTDSVSAHRYWPFSYFVFVAGAAAAADELPLVELVLGLAGLAAAPLAIHAAVIFSTLAGLPRLPGMLHAIFEPSIA
jgi:hypothetical protein